MAAFGGNFTTIPDREAHLSGATAGGSNLNDFMMKELQSKRSERPSSNSGSTAVSEAGENSKKDPLDKDESDVEIRKLARKASRQASTLNEGDQNPFGDQKDPRFDPHSPSFNARAYAQAVLSVHSRDERAVPHRQAGVAFRNLTASGYGSETDYQVSHQTHGPTFSPSAKQSFSNLENCSKLASCCYLRGSQTFRWQGPSSSNLTKPRWAGKSGRDVCCTWTPRKWLFNLFEDYCGRNARFLVRERK